MATESSKQAEPPARSTMFAQRRQVVNVPQYFAVQSEESLSALCRGSHFMFDVRLASKAEARGRCCVYSALVSKE
ncbi:hypothetical protein K437DRAFT_257829 [Tilletiaria anomala UBC 951]|uniref:Uncharacterized protein n=1 Tax=Tilletiaria anomala (strain ATCC 24038 / CBS 436.72 / UBC 951) TaxID=1037660 RepID=A0A066VVB7_TILAU|nr:uncharacterized protein K437DRAFT_257829 [Tilletiaria anomala UBC 951]KDN42495.1 hypothetical protein K437DRAFT_257829 [Tilletiaria anomala UBC 951]